MTFCELLKHHRSASGLSRRVLGERLGVHRQSIYNWEAGVRRPLPERLSDIERELGLADGALTQPYREAVDDAADVGT